MATYRRAKSGPILTGVAECDAMLKAVGTKVGNRAARSVLAKAVRLAVKRIKAKVPSAQKSVRAAIGGNVKRRKGGADRGLVTAKAGAAVGAGAKAKAAGKKRTRLGRDSTTGRFGSVESKGGGIGIGAENIHWYILGTGERTVRKTGQRVGRMPAHPIVKDAMAAGGGEIVTLMKREMRPAIERESEKEARRLLKKRSR
jgi:hypothetical protein